MTWKASPWIWASTAGAMAAAATVLIVAQAAPIYRASARIAFEARVFNGGATAETVDQWRTEIAHELQAVRPEAGLQTAWLGDERTIEIAVEGADGALAARTADEIAERYLEQMRASIVEANERATSWLDERIGELRRNMEVAQEAVTTYRRAKALRDAEPPRVVPTLREVHDRYIAMKALRQELEARLSALGDAASTDVLQATRSALSTAQMEEEKARRLVEILALGKQGPDQYEAELKQLEREAESNRVLYEGFIRRFHELRAQQPAEQMDARIAARASVSRLPPRLDQWLIALVAGGLAGAAAWAIARHRQRSA